MIVVALPVMSQVVPPQMALHAVKVTKFVLGSDGVGHQLNVPEVFVAFRANVAPTIIGDIVKELIGSPSGSAAVTTKLRHWPTATDCEPGARTTGPRADNVRVMFVCAKPTAPVFECAVKVML